MVIVCRSRAVRDLDCKSFTFYDSCYSSSIMLFILDIRF